MVNIYERLGDRAAADAARAALVAKAGARR
jgi:hypothetical protein